jgi:hypothetical protein
MERGSAISVGRSGGDADQDGQPAVLGAPPVEFDAVARGIGEIDFLWVEDEFSRLDLGGVENIADQIQQVMAGLEDEPGIFLVFSVQRAKELGAHGI